MAKVQGYGLGRLVFVIAISLSRSWLRISGNGPARIYSPVNTLLQNAVDDSFCDARWLVGSNMELSSTARVKSCRRIHQYRQLERRKYPEKNTKSVTEGVYFVGWHGGVDCR